MATEKENCFHHINDDFRINCVKCKKGVILFFLPFLRIENKWCLFKEKRRIIRGIDFEKMPFDFLLVKGKIFLQVIHK